MRIMIAAFACAVSVCAPAATPKSATKTDIAAIRDSMQDYLKDASSAQFRNVVKIGTDVCGEVNAKNGFGGYTGFRKFAAGVLPAKHGEVAMIIAIDDEDGNQATQICVEKGM